MPTCRIGSCINRTGLLAIAFISFGYVIFGAVFAKVCLWFSFLDCPIFIGEILLIFCSALLIWKILRRELSLGWWVFVLGGYLFFILVRAFVGYAQWGPLAFRDAALFYYLLFIVFGFFFWQESDWGVTIRRIFLLLLLVLLTFKLFYLFWPFSLVFLALILALCEKKLALRIFFIITVLALSPYGNLFSGDKRTVILSSASTLCFVVIALMLFLKNKHARILGLVLGLILTIVFFLRIVGSQVWRTMNPKILLSGAMLAATPFPVVVPEKIVVVPEKTVVAGAVSSTASSLKKSPAAVPSESVFRKGPSSYSEDTFYREKTTKKVRLFNPLVAGSDGRDTVKIFYRRAISLFSKVFRVHVPFSEAHINSNEAYVYSGEADIDSRRSQDKLEVDSFFVLKKATALFRYYIWRDMVKEWLWYKPFFGFSFGRPCFSSTLSHFSLDETQQRDGWIGAHNSFLYMIYRGGIFGIVLLLGIFILWGVMVKDFIIYRDATGVLLSAIFLNWIVAANFFMIFELPYTAIPVWTILGITIKHWSTLWKSQKSPVH